MKNTKLFLITFLVCTFSLFIYAGQVQQREILLSGKIEKPKGPSRVPEAPSLEVYLDFNAITVYFLNDLGNVTITIINELGEVVHQSIEPSACGATAVIDISGLESGIYTITFRNDGSFYRYGEFEL